MERAKRRRRDPSKEPFAAAISDSQRYLIVKRVKVSDYTEDDVEAIVEDHFRAQKKAAAARSALRDPIGPWSSRFERPDLSEASAMASAEISSSYVEEWAFAGGKVKRTSFKRDKNPRAFSTEHHDDWRCWAREFRDSWRKTHKKPPQIIPMCKAVARRHAEKYAGERPVTFRGVKSWFVRHHTWDDL